MLLHGTRGQKHTSVRWLTQTLRGQSSSPPKPSLKVWVLFWLKSLKQSRQRPHLKPGLVFSYPHTKQCRNFVLFIQLHRIPKDNRFIRNPKTELVKYEEGCVQFHQELSQIKPQQKLFVFIVFWSTENNNNWSVDVLVLTNLYTTHDFPCWDQTANRDTNMLRKHFFCVYGFS